MDKLAPIDNRRLSAFLLTEDNEPEYLECGVSDIMWPNSVILFAHFAMCQTLFDFPNGATIELIYKDCGIRDNYHSDETIIRLDNCRLEKKWAENVVAVRPSDQEFVTLQFNIHADIEVFLDRANELARF